jgi:hypothetical protein
MNLLPADSAGKFKIYNSKFKKCMAESFLIISVAIILLVMVLLAEMFYNIVFRGFAPFVSSKSAVVNKVLDSIDLVQVNKIYELGSGKAGFLKAARAKFPNVELIGVENSFWPYLLSSIQSACQGLKIKFKKKNLFKVDVSEADLIYCYLNQKMMQKLADKFKNECRVGAVIVSYRFPLPNWQPERTEVVDGGKIYFYKA